MTQDIPSKAFCKTEVKLPSCPEAEGLASSSSTFFFFFFFFFSALTFIQAAFDIFPLCLIQ